MALRPVKPYKAELKLRLAEALERETAAKADAALYRQLAKSFAGIVIAADIGDCKPGQDCFCRRCVIARGIIDDLSPDELRVVLAR